MWEYALVYRYERDETRESRPDVGYSLLPGTLVRHAQFQEVASSKDARSPGGKLKVIDENKSQLPVGLAHRYVRHHVG